MEINALKTEFPAMELLEKINKSEVAPGEELDVVESLVGKKRMKGQIHCQTGQPPVPLGGPEHGVVTYPHILDQEYNKANIPEQFFKQLTGIYFSDEELFRGNYTGGGAHEALNRTILGAILAETNRQYKDEKIKLYRVVTEKCCRVRATHKARKNKPVALPDANRQQRQQDLMISTVVGDALLSLRTSRCNFTSFRRTTKPHVVYKERELNAKLGGGKSDAPRALAASIRLGQVFLLDEEQAALSDNEQRPGTILQGGPRTAQVYVLPVWFTHQLIAKSPPALELQEILGSGDS
ncbi:hypothetical protein Bbelb_292000 [Branchiostoma belcheri]|nr:hypothetical protein Bbelb_292000 [Branchiostoma belcheri]